MSETKNTSNISEIILNGLSICEGAGLGNILKIEPLESLIETHLSENPKTELEKFNNSLAIVQNETLELSKSPKLGPSEKKIFEAHLMMLEDPEFIDQIRELIKNEKWMPSKAISHVAQMFSDMLRALSDPYMQERAHDIQDISERLLRTISGQKLNQIQASENCILVLKDITPSQVVQLNGSSVLGVLTEEGGVTSHSAILLRSFDIPAIFGINDLMKNSDQKLKIAFDSTKGKVWIHPNEQTQGFIQDKIKIEVEKKNEKQVLKKLTPETKDGHRVMLYANIGNPSEFNLLDEYPLDGVGLFRTEFLFMDRVIAPSEDEQFEIYKRLLQKTSGKKTIIRTLDIGGDKQLPYLNIPKEENPFLGLRGLRYCLEDLPLFRTQIRALLRASEFGLLYVMYPMVTEVEEVIKAQTIIDEEIKNLENKYNKKIKLPKVGVMIEIPAAAINVESFLAKIDFVSLGTNDLIQYTCAADRMNPKVKSLYHHFHPSIINLITFVADKCKQHNKEISICGEMGGDPELTPFLLATGINHLSMSVARSPKVKKQIRSITFKNLPKYLEQLAQIKTATHVKEFIQNFHFI